MSYGAPPYGAATLMETLDYYYGAQYPMFSNEENPYFSVSEA